MNVTYEWKIMNAIKKPSLNGMDNVITRIVYEYKGTDSESGYSFTKLGGLDLAAPSGDTFTAITDLTQEQVEGWLNEHPEIPKMQKEVEMNIQYQIDKDEEDATEIEWIDNNPVAETVMHPEPEEVVVDENGK